MRSSFAREVLERSIPDRFEDQVRRHRDRVAVAFGGSEITYGSLAERVAQIAAAIEGVAGTTPRAVAIVLPQGIGQIAAILAVLDAGCWYVPVDADDDAQRLRETLRRAGAALVIADAATVESAVRASTGLCPVLCIDDVAAGARRATRGRAVAADALAYVYFTSGTAGVPKGVVDTHRNVLHNVLRYTNTLQIGPLDRLTLLQSSTFSGAVSNVFGALLNGATLLPYDAQRDGLGDRFPRWLAEARPTIYHSVPTIFRRACVPGSRYASVRVVRIEGDGAAPSDVASFFRHFGQEAVLVHGLGTTETGLCRQFFVRHGDAMPAPRVPIGYPVEDMEVCLIDDRGEPVPAGAIGEIAVRSRYLALGYWNDAERTARAFRRIPELAGLREYRTGDLGRLHADGCLEHLGRADFQVKVHGQWVDTAAVELALAGVAGVREAIVVAEPDERQESVLVAYVVPDEGAAPTLASIRRALGAQLPPIAIPVRAWRVDELPLGPNGKVDRRSVRRPGARLLDAGTTPTAPRDATEAALASIWREVLGHCRFGVEDAFCDIGGDSLAGADVALAIESRLGVSLAPADLLTAGTIAGLAARLRPPRAAGSAPLNGHAGQVVPLRAQGRRPPLFCIHDLGDDPFLFARLSRHIDPDQPLFALRPRFDGAKSAVPGTIEALARRYVEAMRELAPAGPYRLAGFCYGGVVALEMARQLRASGAGVLQLALLNVSPYDLPNLVSAQARRQFRYDLAARLRYLRAKPDAGRWLATRVMRALRDLGWQVRLPCERRLGANGGASSGFVRAALQSAFRNHCPARYDGPLTLVVAAETMQLYADDARAAWVGITSGPLSVHCLPQDGAAMLDEPAVGRLARWLSNGSETGAVEAPDGTLPQPVGNPT